MVLSDHHPLEWLRISSDHDPISYFFPNKAQNVCLKTLRNCLKVRKEGANNSLLNNNGKAALPGFLIMMISYHFLKRNASKPLIGNLPDFLLARFNVLITERT